MKHKTNQSWFRFLTAHLLVFVMSFSPLAAYAGIPKVENRSYLDKDAIVDFEQVDLKKFPELTREDLKALKNITITARKSDRVRYDAVQRQILIFDEKGEIRTRIEIGSRASASRFSFKTLSGKAATMFKTMRPGETLEHTIVKFPVEAFTFMLAVGAVVAVQLFTNYAGNPMAMEEHIEHQLSPLGALGFFMFMYSQGITQNMLSTMLKNPNLSPMIPYLSMSAGFFVQSFFSAWVSDPNLKECVTSVMGGDKANGNKDPMAAAAEENSAPCQKAFSLSVLGGRVYEAIPSLGSMLSATVLAGYAQKYALNAIKISELDVMIWGLAGGGVNAVRLALLKGSQIAAFYWLDAGFLNFYYTSAFKHAELGSKIESLDKKIIEGLLIERSNLAKQKADKNWTEEMATPSNLAASVSELTDTMSTLRMVEMQDIYTATNSWKARLLQMTGMAALISEFYGNFVSEIRAFRGNTKLDPTRSNLFKPYMYLDLNDSSVPEENRPAAWSKADNYEYFKLSTIVKKVGEEISAMISDKSKWPVGIFPWEIKELEKITANFTNDKDLIVQGSALFDYVRTYHPERAYPDSVSSNTISAKAWSSNSDAYRNLIQSIDAKLGPVRPTREPGRGFLLMQSKYSKNTAILPTLKFNHSVGAYKVSDVYEYMLLNMACGLDATSPDLISNWFGAASTLTPPKIIVTKSTPDFCKVGSVYPSSMIYTREVTVDNITYKSAFEFITKNIRPEFFASNDDPEMTKKIFPAYWERSTQAVIKNAINKFEIEYNEVNATLLNTLRQGGNSRFSADWANVFKSSAASVIPLKSMMQQARVNLFVLGEIYKSSFEATHNKPVFNFRLSSVDSNPTELPTVHRNFPLLYLMKTNPTYDLNDVLKGWKYAGDETLGETKLEVKKLIQEPNNKVLQAQREIEWYFEYMNSMYNSIQVQEVVRPARKLIRGKLTNAAVDKLHADFKKAVDNFAYRMDVGEFSEQCKGYDANKIENILKQINKHLRELRRMQMSSEQNNNNTEFSKNLEQAELYSSVVLNLQKNCSSLPRVDVQMSEANKQNAVAALNGIKNVFEEMVLMIKIANAVNYDNMVKGDDKAKNDSLAENDKKIDTATGKAKAAAGVGSMTKIGTGK